jgi:hypothetical protein
MRVLMISPCFLIPKRAGEHRELARRSTTIFSICDLVLGFGLPVTSRTGAESAARKVGDLAQVSPHLGSTRSTPSRQGVP